MKNPGFHFFFPAFFLATMISFTAEAQREIQVPSDDQILKRAPEGVTFIPNISYREGYKTWKLDLAMPPVVGSAPRPAIVFILEGGWENGDERADSFPNPTLDYAAKGHVSVTVNHLLLGDETGHGLFQRNPSITEPVREAFFNSILKPAE